MAIDANELIKTLDRTSKDSFSDEESRARAAAAARSLFLHLESPYERMKRNGWAEVITDALRMSSRCSRQTYAFRSPLST